MAYRTVYRLLPALLAVLLLAGCATGSRLYVPGDLQRPSGSPPRAEGYPQVAVADFSYTAPTDSPDVIGRDYDQVRQIVWKGDPGKQMADLVAAVLSERGIPAVRVKAGAAPSGNIPYQVSGSVRRFEVNTRRGGVVTVLTEATVSLAVSVSGPAVSSPWEATVTSSTTVQDMFPVPEDLRKALLSAANSASEEAVRRLREGGVIAASPGEGKGGDGAPK
ncbi:MAG: hypothetical protein ACM3L8_07040, partial [Verrucomicrobiota bacterium]